MLDTKPVKVFLRRFLQACAIECHSAFLIYSAVLGGRTLEQMKKADAMSKVSRAWDDARDSAANLGEKLGRKMDDAMRDLGETLDDMMSGRSSRDREGSVSL